jgi:aminoglycoside phosphotransferase (APT) family kinase protein
MMAKTVGAESPRHPSERNGSWRVFLPAAMSGLVALVDLEPGTAAAFRRSYPSAITVSADRAALVGVARGMCWDGRHWPLPDGALALLVADERRADPTALAAALRPGGRRAAIVPARRRHDTVPYPRADSVERLLRKGWPASTDAPGQWIRQRLATSVLWRLSGRAGIAIEPDGPGLIDDVVADLGAAVGSRATLRGVLVSGSHNIIVRVGLAREEAALRLCLTELGTARLARQRQVLASIDDALLSPDLHAHMPRELAVGVTHGLEWRAETWHQGHLSPGGRRWRTGGSTWKAAHEVARLLAATAPTADAGPGWAHAWTRGIDQFGEDADAIEAALLPIEEFRLPTSWCHGDFWPGNIVLGRGSTVVIDWEQGRAAAPAGLDAVFLELYRLAIGSRIPIGVAAARAVREPRALTAPPSLGGVPWPAADPALRAASVVAAIVVHALGPEGDRRGSRWAHENLVPLISALAGRPG